MAGDLERARDGDEHAFGELVQPHRNELRAHCYRMSGSADDAEDLLQESLVRAWRGLAGFKGRASVRTWLFRVATNTCLDALRSRARRGLPTSLGPPSSPEQITAPRLEPIWLQPCPNAWLGAAPTPESLFDAREGVALAFLAAIQNLPPRQRATLLLRDVVGFAASECAALLETSPAAVNSALQRARETLASLPHREPAPVDDEATRELLARYVRAWEDTDVDALVALLRDDAVLAMPPLAQWLVGPQDIGQSIGHMVFHPGARGNIRMVPTHANGRPAIAMYDRSADGPFAARSLHIPYLDGDRVSQIVAFMDPTVFGPLGLPATVE
ncbi:MAG: sigma-70 family RNA polymerase sigma factor [Myxococcota bacterium]